MLPSFLIEDAAAPLFWPPARTGVDSAWTGHVPFAHWLVAAIRPRLVVELGTHNGVSFAAFCEPVRRLALACRCVAIDTWEGDAHAGFYGSDVLRDLAAFVASRYAGFAVLRRARFEAARAAFADGSIDVLHLDGRHRYEDVKSDFALWQSALSPRAVVLLHDVCEQAADFGVHRFWAEITADRPHFVFPHAHGLGVLLHGTAAPPALRTLCRLRFSRAEALVQARFAALGAGAAALAEQAAHRQAVVRLRDHQAALEAHIAALGAYAATLEARAGLA